MLKRRSLLIGAAALLSSPSIVRAIGGGSSTDPYILPTLPGYQPGWQAYGGRTQVAPSSLAGSVGCILIFGDSVCSNIVNSIYTPTQANNLNFNVYNGGLYRTVEPLLGCNYNTGLVPPSGNGCFFSRVGDQLITNAVYANVVLVPSGLGGSLLADYASGGALNGQFTPIKKRLDAAGLTLTGIYCMLGANDTNVGTLQAPATTSMASIISTLRAIWATTPIFVAKHSMFALATSAAIQNAQASVLSAGNFVYDGGNMDSLTGAGNYWDSGTHYNATGAAAAAPLAVTAITAHP